MKTGKIAAAALSLGVVMSSFSSLAYADPQSRPNGPWVENEQNIALSSIMTNEELYKKLHKLEDRSNGKMTLDIAGYSNDGSPLYVAKFGEADPDKKRVMIMTQIHGNEPLGTEAIVEMMQKFLTGGKEVNHILDKVSIWFMPRVNPDGTMNQYEGEWYPVRYNHETWNPTELGLPEGTEAPWYYNSEGSERAQNNNGRIVYGIPGYDVNRDFSPNLDFRIQNLDKQDTSELVHILNSEELNNGRMTGYFVSPEARAITKAFKNMQPDVVFDLHHRGFNTLTDTDNRQVSIEVLGKFTKSYTDPFTGKTYKLDPDVVKMSKQINVIGWKALQRGFSSFGAIQRYPDVDLPGSGLGAFSLNGAATMLIEIKGQTQTLGQKQNGKLKQTVKVPVYAILKALANGTVKNADASLYEEIPKAQNYISDPTTRDR